MARTRGGGLGAQGRPKGRGRGRDAQTDRMGIVERVESTNRSWRKKFIRTRIGTDNHIKPSYSPSELENNSG